MRSQSTLFLCTTLASGLLLASAQLPGAEGPSIWRSNGYGVIARIDSGHTTLYDVTEDFCLRKKAGPWSELPLAQAAERAARADSFSTLGPWGLTLVHFERIESLPARCDDTTRDARDPLYNFDVFWQTFDEHYAFFAKRGVDWRALRDEYRPLLSSSSTDDQLLNVFDAALRQLQDRHVTLTAGTRRLQSGLPAIIERWYAQDDRVAAGAREALLRARLFEYLQPAWNTYLDPGSLRRVSDNLTIGTARGNRIAYLSIAAESGYAPGGSIAEDRDAAVAQLTKVFADFAGKQGLVIDLRMNPGGSDEVGLAIAGLLTARDRPGFAKCARAAAGSTPSQQTSIRHLPGAFIGPVVLLISPLTASAAENLAMLVKDFPNVVLVGDRTAGVHSDPLLKSLPNGWTFLLSNEYFVAPDGRSHEGVGIPPDVLVAYDPEQVRVTGIDPLLEKALHLLAAGRHAGPQTIPLRERVDTPRRLPCPAR